MTDLLNLYTAGAMTGIPQFNFPAFDALAASLRAAGYSVVSPAELDDESDRLAALASPDGAPGSGSHQGKTWGDFLARDVKLIADEGIDGIVVMDNWSKSRGARLETFVAFLCGLPIYRWDATYQELTKVGLLSLARGWLSKSDVSFHTQPDYDRPSVGSHG